MRATGLTWQVGWAGACENLGVDVSEYSRRIEAAGLGQYRDALVSAVEPSIRLVSTGSVSDGLVGASRLGGLPDLPAETVWPDNDGEPLSFIAQLNLAEAHAFDAGGLLPESGLLSFFYDAVSQEAWGFDPADHGSFAVIYSPPSAPLVRREAPAALDSEGAFFPVALTMASEPTFVPWESSTTEALGMNFEAALEYASIFTDDGSDQVLVHRLLGHPDPIQGDMQLECQLASNGIYCGDASGYQDPRATALRRDAGDWRLLLQIDSDEDAGMMWGDVGRIYYWIRAEDLHQRDWERSWLVLQCS